MISERVFKIIFFACLVATSVSHSLSYQDNVDEWKNCQSDRAKILSLLSAGLEASQQDTLLKEFYQKGIVKRSAGNTLIEDAEVIILAEIESVYGWENIKNIVHVLSTERQKNKDIFLQEGFEYLKPLPSKYQEYPSVKDLKESVEVLGWEDMQALKKHQYILDEEALFGNFASLSINFKQDEEFLGQIELLENAIKLCRDVINSGNERAESIISALSYLLKSDSADKSRRIYVRVSLATINPDILQEIAAKFKYVLLLVNG